MTLMSLFGLASAMLILAASPGPGVFATVARAMATGFRSSLPVIAGIVIGDIAFLLLAVFGLSAIAHVLGDFFGWVKIAGGLYLVWLGIRIWSQRPMRANVQQGNIQGRNTAASLCSGLLITLSNPKVILFYCGFLPTFLDLQAFSTADVVMAVGVISSVLTLVMTVYAYAGGRARQMLFRRNAVKRMNQTAGAMMVAAGVVVAARA